MTEEAKSKAPGFTLRQFVKAGGDRLKLSVVVDAGLDHPVIEPMMYVIDIACQAMREAGVEPKIKPIRGGTDGAQLSFKGLPCPNIFAGGLNFHGRHEFVPIQSMEKAMMTVVNICRITAEQ